MKRLCTIALTSGDPCGIGPEVLLKTLRIVRSLPSLRLLVIGDHEVFARLARRLRQPMPTWDVVSSIEALTERPTRLVFLDCGHRSRFQIGGSNRHAGQASLAYLDQAIAGWRRGAIDAVVTGPITKWAVALGAPGFIGQTEYLASAMGRREVVMMFVSDRLRVALVTRHLPLGEVPRRVTSRTLEATIQLTVEALQKSFRIRHPRVAVCGINPHAGEHGRCGREERRVMEPVLERLRRRGISCDGPLAADGLFADASRYDVVVCAYHDQGLIPFKMTARDAGCQLSVGLPIIRTSPDHGSGLDIAGRGIAQPGSMIYALQLAMKLASAKR